jgi:hypothetical protein
MKRAFMQGELDSLCGMYSIVNADRIINNSSKEQSQELFNSIILYLAKKRMLTGVILEGTDHRVMTKVMRDVVGDRIPLQITNKRNFKNLKEWWKYSKNFLEEASNRSIIASIGGKQGHLTVIREMSERRMVLLDSSWLVIMKRIDCRFTDYAWEDKHVIYPSQCWYLGRETSH